MILYLVKADEGDGENKDLFVVAKGSLNAIPLWQDHYETDETPERVFRVAVGQEGPERVLQWNTDVPVAWRAP